MFVRVRLTRQETLGIGVNRSGAFAEYPALPAMNVWKSSGICKDHLSLFDPLGNATHAALSWNLLGEDVLITGAGPIGIMAAAVCRHAGARHVVITDVNDYCLNLARSMGASRTVNVKRDDLNDVKKELGIIEGFDIGLEMSGVPSALHTMIDQLRHGGKISMLGIMPDDTGTPWTQIVFKGLTIKGIYGREMFNTWYQMDAMLHSGLNLEKIITHRYHFTEFCKGAFDTMLSGQSGKSYLELGGLK